MKEVYRDPDPVRLGLFRSLLESRGIATQVENDHENDALGIQRMGPPRLDPVLCVIDEADYETALELLREHQSGDGGKSEQEVACAACGEPNPGNFEICWSCGKPVA